MSRRDCVVLCVLVFMAATLYLVFSRGSQQESMVLEDVGPLSPPGEPLKGPPGLPVARSLLPVIIDGRRSTPAAPPPAGGTGVFGITGGAPAPARGPAPAPAGRRGSSVPFDEQRFLRLHGAQVEAYHAKLSQIGSRYYERYKVVRDVDAAFTAMPRYMAVLAAYSQDKDPFKFARGAIALPEVRAEISKRVADPQAWKAAIGMINEALKDPPPPEVYFAAQNFMASNAMEQYMKEFTAQARNNIGAIVGAMPTGADGEALQKLAREAMPGAVAGLPAADGRQPRR